MPLLLLLLLLLFFLSGWLFRDEAGYYLAYIGDRAGRAANYDISIDIHKRANRLFAAHIEAMDGGDTAVAVSCGASQLSNAETGNDSALGSAEIRTGAGARGLDQWIGYQADSSMSCGSDVSSCFRLSVGRAGRTGGGQLGKAPPGALTLAPALALPLPLP